MFLDLAGSALFFLCISLGLAWPLAARLDLEPTEKLGASVMLSLLAVFLFGWTVYAASLPVALLRVLPGLTALGLFLNRRILATTLRAPDVRALLAAQLIVTAWCLGCLALVISYSGGGWLADWWGHRQRTMFFLERWPRDILFNGFDPMPSRPPLANIVNGVFLECTQRSFQYYQLFSTLFSSLVFLPAALLARRFGGPRAMAILAVLFMLNPLFIQNATFAWTKLPTAFFILTSLYFFLRAHGTTAPTSAGNLFALSLAAGLLTHYSTGPYAVLLALAWVGFGWARRNEIAWWRTTAFAALAGLLVLATWFGWALAVFGWHGAFLTNTSITDQAPSVGAQLQVVALNLRDTLIPHFFRTVDFTPFTQHSSVGWWRDWFFYLYQTNFFFTFGSVAAAGILAALARTWRGSPVTVRLFWTLFVTGTAIVGIGVHAARDTWGLAHICLQPLVLLGLAFLAAQWGACSRPWKAALVVGAILDLVFGIVIHFWVQSAGLSQSTGSALAQVNLETDYSPVTQMNLLAKSYGHWIFVGDVFAPQAVRVCCLLGLLLLLAVLRAGRSPTQLKPQRQSNA